MAEKNGDEELDTDQRIRRSAARTLANWAAVLISLGLIGSWMMTGIYYLEPGEAAVVLFLGAYHDTVREPGTRWTLPTPIGMVEKVNVTEIRRLEFGFEEQDVAASKDGDSPNISQNAVQTADSNIVIPSYVLQYTIKDPFSFLYTLQDPIQTLRDATQAAVREVIGQQEIDAVLSSNRAGVEREAKTILEETLARYAGGDPTKAAFEIRDIQLQSVQPPRDVQAAFDDVVAAQQDQARAESGARGDAQEILEKANAEAIEVTQSAEAYRDAKVLEAEGEAARFEALLAEYQNAREVTRRRYYIETMEAVLPDVQTIVVEKDAVQMLPLLSLPSRREGGS